jgi:hypothetical protein
LCLSPSISLTKQLTIIICIRSTITIQLVVLVPS